MQVTKTYSGTAALGSTVSRAVSYGVTTKSTVYPGKVNAVNSVIADFLRSECGVDAYYETRPGSDDAFLWIYGVPFLFNVAGTNNYMAFYGPMSGSALNAGSNSGGTYNAGLSTVFNGITGDYSFSPIFAGNPDNGFSLRFKTYHSTSVSQHFCIRFLKCVNLINGLNSVVWCAQNIYSSGNDTTSSELLSGMNGIDLDASHSIKTDSFSNQFIKYDPLLHTKTADRSSNYGALPLVPLCIGPHRANGIYLYPANFGLPRANGITTEIQPEVTISGRSFLLTNSGTSVGSGYINMGMIETT